MNVGDYVLATKYSDGDPGDGWALGFYAGPLGGTENGLPVRYMVVDGKGENIRGNGFRRVARVRRDVGQWLLNVAATQLEHSPPGTVNLWTMLTPAAFETRDEQDRPRILASKEPHMSADNMPPLPLRTWRLSPAWDAQEEEAIYAYARAYATAQCAPLAEALELIASPIRSDGTWNRDREACRQVAAKALAKP